MKLSPCHLKDANPFMRNLQFFLDLAEEIIQ